MNRPTYFMIFEWIEISKKRWPVQPAIVECKFIYFFFSNQKLSQWQSGWRGMAREDFQSVIRLQPKISDIVVVVIIVVSDQSLSHSVSVFKATSPKHEANISNDGENDKNWCKDQSKVATVKCRRVGDWILKDRRLVWAILSKLFFQFVLLLLFTLLNIFSVWLFTLFTHIVIVIFRCLRWIHGNRCV